MAPAISVLLPLRDGEATIAEALQSVQQQTLQEIEIVVVDDGSQDRGPALVGEVAARDGRVRLLRQGPQGIVAALNAGLAATRAPLIARMDADDFSFPERFALQLKALQRRPQIAVMSSLVEGFGAEQENDGWLRYLHWLNGRVRERDIRRDLWVESPLAHPSVVMRREALMAVGGYRDFDGPEDYDLWLRMAQAGYRFGKVAKVLLRWRDHSARLTRTDGRYRAEAFMRTKVTHLLAGPLAQTLAGRRPLLVWGAGRDGGRFARELLAAGASVAAFVDIDSRKIGGQRHGCPVIAPGAIGAFARPVVVAAVGVSGARRLIRGRLTRLGLRECEDYFMCA